VSIRRLVRAGALVAVAGALTAAGLTYHHLSADPYRAPAAALALVIGCADYAPDDLPGAAHEQGTCHLDGTRVTVATFDGAEQQRAYSQRLTSLLPRFTHRGGAYAEGDGWAVVDGAALSRDVAARVVDRAGGTVREVTAPAAS
jgi:hypothetical protein